MLHRPAMPGFKSYLKVQVSTTFTCTIVLNVLCHTLSKKREILNCSMVSIMFCLLSATHSWLCIVILLKEKIRTKEFDKLVV